ncbi:MAG: XTP/dITP diphosphohydrolase [Sphingobacteriales bacterium]
MKNKLVVATNNAHKLDEIRSKLSSLEVLSLKDIEFFEEIPEDGDTLEANSLQKAKHIHDRYKLDCFADDTGLMIEALNDEPGVYSARYAGPNCSFQDNMDKVLSKMQREENRKAKFVTCICLILNGKTHYFKGEVEGEILQVPAGKDGFGYDPIFKPLGFKETFAQMSMEQKNQISHRGRAVQKLVDFLSK